MSFRVNQIGKYFPKPNNIGLQDFYTNLELMPKIHVYCYFSMGFKVAFGCVAIHQRDRDSQFSKGCYSFGIQGTRDGDSQI